MADANAGELFTTRRAKLYLVDGSQSALMQSGQFSLMLVKNPVSQLAAVVAMVGEVQWPVGRDASVICRSWSIFWRNILIVRDLREFKVGLHICVEA
ncbi:hypothetical protein L7F22_024976 [Adiantum nelumboides]|nr:hypothetical protein [Adiantum nelumboides]